MHILVLNAGSSSIKFELFINKTPGDFKSITSGLADRLYLAESKIKIKIGERKVEFVKEMLDHSTALENVIRILVEQEKVIKNTEQIKVVGHRIVHGGEKYASSVVIDDEVIAEIENCVQFAPLHNPANLKGIYASKKAFSSAIQVGVFDTAFHQTLPPHAYIYGIPYSYYKKYGVRRYGFHGTSHDFVSKAYAEMIGKPVSELNVITCHLGNGASVAAIKNGKSIDTSMGFTPLEGLMMGTRSGDLDPALVLWLVEKNNNDIDAVNRILNKESGFLGVTEETNDCKPIEDNYDKAEKCKLAMDIFSYRVKKYIGSYMAALGRVDCIIFTGGIGENSEMIREMSTDNMESFGVKLDTEKNIGRFKKSAIISTPDSNIQIAVIPTNEQLSIAQECAKLT
ncbi:acetate kinase [bacterium]|nr:acetate kinase [bacterium]